MVLTAVFDADCWTDCEWQAYADEIGAMFIETSAKDDLNVQKIFIDLSKLTINTHHNHDKAH